MNEANNTCNERDNFTFLVVKKEYVENLKKYSKKSGLFYK
ncbi:MAG: hypothetical protein PWQ85_1145 [Geotoga sp.]|nr:hypothetical protein [Geotoga sp.]